MVMPLLGLQEVTVANFNRKVLSAVKFDGTVLAAILSSSDLNKLLEALVEETFKDGQVCSPVRTFLIYSPVVGRAG